MFNIIKVLTIELQVIMFFSSEVAVRCFESALTSFILRQKKKKTPPILSATMKWLMLLFVIQSIIVPCLFVT